MLEEVGDTWHLAEALNFSSYWYYAQSDYVKARALGGECLTLCRTLGDLWGSTAILQPLGLFAFAQGDNATARTCYEESLTISRTVGEKRVTALCLLGLGEVVAVEGKPATAARLWGAAETLRAELGAFIPRALLSRTTAGGDVADKYGCLRVIISAVPINYPTAQSGMLDF